MRKQCLSVICLILVVLFLGGIAAGCKSKEVSTTTPEPTTPVPTAPESYVKNVILLIGDGMGLAQLDAAKLYYEGKEGHLNIQKMPVSGFITTFAADNIITDSAAAGTALATGFKTNTGVVSQSPSGEEYITIAEACKQKNMSIGIVTTTSIFDATPASFSAHAASRKEFATIAAGILANKYNVVFGGGRRDYAGILDEAATAGYKTVVSEEEMNMAEDEYLMGLFNDYDMYGTGEDEPTIEEMTKKAIGLLKNNPDGFFLMVEGGLIDAGGHEQDPFFNMEQTKAFDEAVKTALDFASADKNTIVIVTGDHETGAGYIGRGDMDGKGFGFFLADRNHTGISLPLFAYGPDAEVFVGYQDNTSVPKKLADLLELQDFPGKR